MTFPYFSELGLSVEEVVAACLYFCLMGISFITLLVLQTQQMLSLQKNMYLLLVFANLCRTISCGVNAVEQMIYLEVPSLKNSLVLLYVSEGFDILSILTGFAIYLNLVAFWAEQFFLFKDHEKFKNDSFRRKNTVRKATIISFWVIFGVIFLSAATLFFGCVIFEVNPHSLGFDLSKMIFRNVVDILSIIFLVFFAVSLHIIYRNKFKSIPGMKLKRMTVFTSIVTTILVVFIVFNIVKFFVREGYRQFDYRWLIFLFMSVLDMSISVSILLLLKPKNCLTCNFKEIEEIDLGYENIEDDYHQYIVDGTMGGVDGEYGAGYDVNDDEIII